MVHNYTYKCDKCENEIELPVDYDAGTCQSCNGQLHRIGESYDQEWVDEWKENERQDDEYERRHSGRFNR